MADNGKLGTAISSITAKLYCHSLEAPSDCIRDWSLTTSTKQVSYRFELHSQPGDPGDVVAVDMALLNEDLSTCKGQVLCAPLRAIGVFFRLLKSLASFQSTSRTWLSMDSECQQSCPYQQGKMHCQVRLESWLLFTASHGQGC
eukprot:3519399-Amphidinium_carterae.2